MFEVGFSELLLIIGLALLVLGPEKLPKVVGQIGRWMGRARAMARQFREQLEDETAEIERQRNAPPPAPPPPATTTEAAVTDADATAPTASEPSIAASADLNNVAPPNEPRT